MVGQEIAIVCEMKRKGFCAPRFEDLPRLHCARYAVMAANYLSGARYFTEDVWDLGRRNHIVKNLSRTEKLEDYIELLEQGKSIVIFFNPLSNYNIEGRKGTHAAVYLGQDKRLFFAEQYFSKQRIIKLSEMKRLLLRPVQIISPK